MSTLQEAMKADGFEHAPLSIEPGKIIRFPGQGSQLGTKNGYCLLFNDLIGGYYGDWKSGFYKTWQSTNHRSLTKKERLDQDISIAESRRNRENEIQKKHESAVHRSRLFIDSSIKANPDHPYLNRKGIKPSGALQYRDALLLPVTHADGCISSVQFVAPDGSKRFLSGGKVRGGMFVISPTDTNNPTILICEGFATGATLHEQTGFTTVCAFNAGNLKTVAMVVRARRKTAPIIICGDDDRLTDGNPGRTKANEAAIACGGKVAFPEWPESAPESLTDFNDLSCWMNRLGQKQ